MFFSSFVNSLECEQTAALSREIFAKLLETSKQLMTKIFIHRSLQSTSLIWAALIRAYFTSYLTAIKTHLAWNCVMLEGFIDGDLTCQHRKQLSKSFEECVIWDVASNLDYSCFGSYICQGERVFEGVLQRMQSVVKLITYSQLIT